MVFQLTRRGPICEPLRCLNRLRASAPQVDAHRIETPLRLATRQPHSVLRGFQKLEQPEYLPAAQGCPQSKIEIFDEDGCSLNISFFLPFYLPRTFCDWLGEYSRN
jgi:hypothetical protein